MAYRTGAGDYAALMADVLAHAIADGWATTGGNWPIQSPSGLWVDWQTDTVVEADVTLGGAGGNKTQRRIRLGMSWTSGAAATAAAPGAPIVTSNAAYTITAWHIFSDLTVSEHILVCFEFSNGVDAQVFSHFGFGLLDQGGLSHGGVGFTGGQYGRGYAVNNGANNLAGDWNSINRTNWAYAGNVGEIDDGGSQLSICLNPTNHPIPAPGPGVGGWPATNTMIQNGANVWIMNRMGDDRDGGWGQVASNFGVHALNWAAEYANPQPFTGSISLMPCPIFIMNGTNSSSVMFYSGSIPNFSMAGMTGYSPGDEFVFGGNTWKLFPVLCQKGNDTLNDSSIVTSGQAGYAYKKVL